MQEILLLCGGDWTDFSRNNGPHQFAAVCRKWRQISLSVSQAWCKVHIPVVADRLRRRIFRQRLRVHLQHCGKYISVKAYRSDAHLWKHICCVASTKLREIVFLDQSFNEGTDELCETLFPVLTAVRDKYHFALNAPNLTTLESTFASHLMYPQLQFLQRRVATLRDAFSTLYCFRNLRKLHLSVRSAGLVWPHAFVKLELSNLEFLFITNLECNYTTSYANATESHFLSNISCPRLQSLRLYLPIHPVTMVNFLRTTPCLTCLGLLLDGRDPQGINIIATQTPLVTHLAFRLVVPKVATNTVSNHKEIFIAASASWPRVYTLEVAFPIPSVANFVAVDNVCLWMSTQSALRNVIWVLGGWALPRVFDSWKKSRMQVQIEKTMMLPRHHLFQSTVTVRGNPVDRPPCWKSSWDV